MNQRSLQWKRETLFIFKKNGKNHETNNLKVIKEILQTKFGEIKYKISKRKEGKFNSPESLFLTDPKAACPVTSEPR